MASLGFCHACGKKTEVYKPIISIIRNVPFQNVLDRGMTTSFLRVGVGDGRKEGLWMFHIGVGKMGKI